MEGRPREEPPPVSTPLLEPVAARSHRTARAETQPCPRCDHAMPALKGGSASICPNCGFKDSCCY